MDVKGIQSNNKIVWTRGNPIDILIIRPYLVGIFAEGALEIKCLFNPNSVVQTVEFPLVQLSHWCVGINTLNTKRMEELDRLYFFVARSKSPLVTLMRCTQIDARQQTSFLVEKKLYSTAVKMCEYLLSKHFQKMNEREYRELQRERGFYSFIIKGQYNQAKSLFRRFQVRTEEVVLLFAQMFPTQYINSMIDRLNIDVKQIPYFNERSIATKKGGKDFEKDFLKAMKIFLHFFLFKRDEIRNQIDLIKRGGNRRLLAGKQSSFTASAPRGSIEGADFFFDENVARPTTIAHDSSVSMR